MTKFWKKMVEIFDDIRKLYRFRDPCQELAGYIEFFSETSLDATRHFIKTKEFTVKLFPSYTPTIWINLWSPYHLMNGGECHLIRENTDILVLRNEIVERRNLPTDNIFTVKFYPGGFEAVFGIEQTRIGSDVINLSNIIPAGIIQKLKNRCCFEDRMIFLQDYFLGLLDIEFAENHMYNKFQNAITMYSLANMASSNSQLATEMAMTDKTLYRYFKCLVGAAPKWYFGIVRARAALTAYVADKESFCPYDHGYYDMSHFYKDIVRFTGQKLSLSRS